MASDDEVEKSAAFRIYIRIFAYLTGILYMMFGAVQILKVTGFVRGLDDISFIPGDLVGGAVLIIIGSVFIYGGKSHSTSLNEGLSFILIGSILGLFFSVVYLLILLSDIAEARILTNSDWENWSIVDSIRPGLYLGILSLTFYIITMRGLKGRTKENMNERRC